MSGSKSCAPPLEPDILRSVGEAVRARRTELGKTQAGLAAAAGLTDTTIHNLENGKHPPTLLTLWRVAEALDVTVSSLLPEKP